MSDTIYMKIKNLESVLGADKTAELRNSVIDKQGYRDGLSQ